MATEEYSMKGGKKGHISKRLQKFRDENWVSKLKRKVKKEVKDTARTTAIEDQLKKMGGLSDEEIKRMRGG